MAERKNNNVLHHVVDIVGYAIKLTLAHKKEIALAGPSSHFNHGNNPQFVGKYGKRLCYQDIFTTVVSDV